MKENKLEKLERKLNLAAQECMNMFSKMGSRTMLLFG
ncbi:hypothetical protein ABID22_002161 [Pontibacter aydingkolensis]